MTIRVLVELGLGLKNILFVSCNNPRNIRVGIGRKMF